MSAYRLCLIEDHTVLGSITQQELTASGYQCDRFTSRSNDIDIQSYECFILDVMLPGQNGFSIGKHVREQSETGIIYLTAKIQFSDKERGFGIGADDYLTKPFKVEELILRINALLNRLPKKALTLATGIRVDMHTHQVFDTGESIHLTPIEWRVLGMLVEYIGRPCSRVVLVEAGRGDDMLYSMSRSLDVTIANLRTKLGKSSIKTIPKLGYQLMQRDL